MALNRHIPPVDLSYSGSLDSQSYIDYLKEHILILNSALEHAVDEADGWYDENYGKGQVPELQYIRNYINGSK